MKRRVVQSIYKTGGGRWLDGSLFYEQKVSKRRNARFRPSSEAQERLNEDNARRTLTRLLQDNFREGVDFIVHPTYNTAHLPENGERLEKDMRNFLLRIKRLYKKLGIGGEFKYVGTPVGDNKIRKHLHIVITGSKYPNLTDKIRKLWSFGTCNVDRVQPDGADGLSGIACYIAENHRKAKDIGEASRAKRWSCSRNLKRPEPKERRGALPVLLLPKIAAASPAERAEIIEKLPMFKGYEAVEIDVSELAGVPDERKHKIYGNYYVYLRMRRKDESKKQKLRQ